MNYQEALTYIHTNFWQGSKPGLERTYSLLKKMGDPQKSLSFIHVAGTNGKGSFCAMLSSILIHQGLKVGTYTSPYILRFNERMKVNGKDIPDETLAQLTEWVRPFAESMNEKPTEFELITAIAMEYFKREKCDVVVLECGMGGRLDSTNVILSPILSVITGIAMDHTSFLGNSIKEIAAEKAGIIKDGCPVLFCGDDEESKEVIIKKADEKNAPFHTVSRDQMTVQKADLSGTVFSYGKRKDIHLSLLGTYQLKNAQNVLSAVDLLNLCGFSISEGAIFEGLKNVRWPARFELVKKDPILICDGGHNPEGIDGAVESAKMYFPKEKMLIISGVMADKDYLYMASRMAEIAKFVFCITPNNPRALGGAEYAQVFQSMNVPAEVANDSEAALRGALEMARRENCPILCLGSLYMYGEIIAALEKI